MLKLIGFLTGGGWAPLLVSWGVIAAVVGGGAGYGAYAYEHAFVTAAEAKQQLAEGERDNAKVMLAYTTKERDSVAAINDQQQRQLDAFDAKARVVQSAQAQSIMPLAEERRALQNNTDSILATLRGPDVQVAVDVSSVVKPGFDPRILLGIDWLRCLQDARRSGASPDSCAGRFTLPAGGPGSAGGTTGADRYAPSFDDQRWLLRLVYEFRDWGVGCFDDKRAVAKSQAAGAGPVIGATP